MRSRKKTLAGILLLVTMVGCDDWAITWNLQKPKADVDDHYVDAGPTDLAKSAAYRDTVAERGWIEGLRLMRVRGYGIVAGLGTHGSRECPRRVRERLVQTMYKRSEFSGTGLKPAPFTPEQLIADLDTAVVMIEGEIHAAASKGDTFDVFVRALPGTQTTSLEGGRLYTADLHIYRDVPGGGAVKGRALAIANGPVFVNPFASTPDSATKRTPREGYVIGGGSVEQSRRLRFVLTSPSYQRARRITDAINARFPATRKIADADSPSHVNLRVPSEFRDDPFHFIALARHLYLPQRQGFANGRAKKLAEEILSETAPHPDIALAWEGIGRTVLPILQRLYTDDRPHARFYAALAGLRLGDDVAVEALATFAKSPNSPYRLTAIEEFGRHRRSMRAAGVLRELRDDADPRIRVEAYEALLARGDRAITEKLIGGGAFALDSVASTAANLVYVRRTGFPRIVLFGSGLQCVPPIFYQDANRLLTVSAEENVQQLTLVRRSPFGGGSSPPLSAPLDLGELIDMLGDDPVVVSSTEVHGLAMDYSTIVHALYTLCSSDAVNAQFMMQTASITEMFGPMTSTGREESDL